MKTIFIKTKNGVIEYQVLEENSSQYSCKGYRGIFTTKKSSTFSTREEAHYDTFTKFCFRKLKDEGSNKLIQFLNRSKQLEFVEKFKIEKSEYLI